MKQKQKTDVTASNVVLRWILISPDHQQHWYLQTQFISFLGDNFNIRARYFIKHKYLICQRNSQHTKDYAVWLSQEQTVGFVIRGVF